MLKNQAVWATLFIGLLLCLSACGQKGDLYLPEESSALQNTQK